MSVYLQVGQAIRKRRRELELTQDQLGRAIHLGRTSIVNIESGRQHVSIHHLIAIATALGVEPGSLLPAVAKPDAGPQERLNQQERRKVLGAVKAARGFDQ